ncbi:ankyrin repeat-containing domain protein [Aspergillus germanicus]
MAIALHDLPPEILLLIVESLEADRDINLLAQTNHYFHTITNPYLYTHNARHSSSALLWAVRTSSTHTANLALSHGANPSTKDPTTGKTPLTTAARAGNAELVRLLLANLDAIDTGPMDSGFAVPFANALSAGHMHIARILVATGRVDRVRRRRGGREWVVRILLGTEGVDVDVRDRKGVTPFAWAAGNGHEEVVRMLMDSGKVDVAAEDEDGLTPLGKAVRYGANGVVKLLEARGIN